MPHARLRRLPLLLLCCLTPLCAAESVPAPVAVVAAHPAPIKHATSSVSVTSETSSRPAPGPALLGDSVLPDAPVAPTPAPDQPDIKPVTIDVPAAGRILAPGEMLIVNPGQNLVVECPAEPERALPVLDSLTGDIAWVRLPARPRQVVAIRWLDTSNIKKLVEMEMLQGDLFLAVNPRDQTDKSIAIRGRKQGVVMPNPGATATGGTVAWRGLHHRALKLHCEVDASLRLVGYGDPLLPGAPDIAQSQGLHIFASLRPGALVQNAGECPLVVEQYDSAMAASTRLRLSDAPRRVLLPPETSLTTNGGQFDLRHFYIPEPGQPAGPVRTSHIHADMPAVARTAASVGGEGAQGDGNGRVAEAPAGVLP